MSVKLTFARRVASSDPEALIGEVIPPVIHQKVPLPSLGDHDQVRVGGLTRRPGVIPVAGTRGEVVTAVVIVEPAGATEGVGGRCGNCACT